MVAILNSVVRDSHTEKTIFVQRLEEDKEIRLRCWKGYLSGYLNPGDLRQKLMLKISMKNKIIRKIRVSV